MTKTEAKKEVQKILAQAEGLLEEAGKIMDEHQFTADFMERSYFPRGMKLKPYDEGIDLEDDEDSLMVPDIDGMEWMYFYKHDYGWLAGTWKSSSEWKSC